MAAPTVVPATGTATCRHCHEPIRYGIDFLSTRPEWLHAPNLNRYCGGWDEMHEAAPALAPVVETPPVVLDSIAPTYADLRRKVENAHARAMADPTTPDPWVSVRASELAALLEDVDALDGTTADCIDDPADLRPAPQPTVLVLHTQAQGGIRFEIDPRGERLAWRSGNVVLAHVSGALARIASVLDEALDDEQRPETD